MDNKLGEFLRMRRGSMSLREFASQCRISHTHLDSIEKGADPRTGKHVSVSTETLRLISDGIGVDYLFLACLADGVDPESVKEVLLPAEYSDKIDHAHPIVFNALTANKKRTAAPSEDETAALLQEPYMKEIYETLLRLTPESRELVLANVRAVKDFESSVKKEASPPWKGSPQTP